MASSCVGSGLTEPFEETRDSQLPSAGGMTRLEKNIARVYLHTRPIFCSVQCGTAYALENPRPHGELSLLVLPDHIRLVRALPSRSSANPSLSMGRKLLSVEAHW